MYDCAGEQVLPAAGDRIIVIINYNHVRFYNIINYNYNTLLQVNKSYPLLGTKVEESGEHLIVGVCVWVCVCVCVCV